MLLQQAHLFVELFHLALDDLVDHLLRLAAGERLGAVNFLLLGQDLGSHLFLAEEARVGGGNVHGEIVRQRLEDVGAGHKV